MTRREWLLLGVGAVAVAVLAVVSAWDFGSNAGELRRVQRAQCQQTNIVRDNQYVGITDQIRENERALKKSLGAALEPFRGQIVRQNEARKRRRDELLHVYYQAHQERRPWLVDCGLLR